MGIDHRFGMSVYGVEFLHPPRHSSKSLAMVQMSAANNNVLILPIKDVFKCLRMRFLDPI